MWRALLISALLLTACERGDKTPDAKSPSDSTPTQATDSIVVASYTPEPDDPERRKRDSAEFRLYVDSIGRLERRLAGTGEDGQAAAILLHLGQLYTYAERWMYYGGPGWEFAGQRRDREYYYSDPDADYVYSGSHWKRMIAAFPDDSLADDAAWALAQRNPAGECEGDVTCYLSRDVEPAVEFIRRFPQSNFDSAAVVKANAALASILDEIPDLRAKDKDTIDVDYDPAAVESLLVRYDAAAARLSPSLQSAVRGVTDSLWIRLGKPDRH